MSSRRSFVHRLGLALGGTAIAVVLRRNASGFPAARNSRDLWAVSQGKVGVSPGLPLPVELPGVHIDFLRLRMPDGVHLAATLFLPGSASSSARVPAILEVLPYRKDDDRLGRDLDQQSFYARHGYAGLRVDVRGTGGSEGIPVDEYSEQEHEDTLLIIEWLSRQPWCTGRIGMNGISYD